MFSRVCGDRGCSQLDYFAARLHRGSAHAVRLESAEVASLQLEGRWPVNAAEALAKAIVENYDNPLQSSSIDVPAHVESLLQSLGATTSDSGGKVTYYGSDPITPDRLPYGSISAISLAAKAILIAKIWKERTGEGHEPVLPVRIQGHDCHVYEYTESALVGLPPGVDYHGYAQRYRAFRWRPNRPMVRETESRDTVLRHGVRATVAAGFTAARIHPFHEAGRDSHDG